MLCYMFVARRRSFAPPHGTQGEVSGCIVPARDEITDTGWNGSSVLRIIIVVTLVCRVSVASQCDIRPKVRFTRCLCHY